MYAFFSIKSFWKKGLKAVMFNVESSEIVETAKVSNYERDSLIFEPTAIVAKNIKTEPCANLSFASRMKNKVVDLLVQVKK